MVTGSARTGRRRSARVGEDGPVTQHGYPYQSPGEQGGQPPWGQPSAQAGQPREGQPQHGQIPHGQTHYGQPQAAQYAQQPYGQVPASGYGVPAGTPTYGHVAHPSPGGFVGQQQAGYASQQPAAPNGQALADVWMRLLARLIDGLIVGGLVSIVMTIVIVVIFAIMINTGDGATVLAVLVIAELIAFLLVMAAQYVYDVEFAKRDGQTLGKRVLKLRVVPLDPDQPLDRTVLAKRWLVSGPGGLVPGLGILNVIWCLWDQPYRQCLHDKFAKTVVVKVPA
jgi:uncharacterized RDD family membrane protein YckC